MLRSAHVFASIFIVGLLCTSSAPAQSLADAAAAAAKARQSHATKVYTNDDLGSAGSDVVPEATVDITPAMEHDPQRQQAISALRAVSSALNGGANRSQFTDRFLDAKAVVDALPQEPQNVAIRRASDLYRDVAQLSVARIASAMSRQQVDYFRRAYGADAQFMGFFSRVPIGGFGPNTPTPSFANAEASIDVNSAMQVLILRAASLVTSLK